MQLACKYEDEDRTMLLEPGGHPFSPQRQSMGAGNYFAIRKVWEAASFACVEDVGESIERGFAHYWVRKPVQESARSMCSNRMEGTWSTVSSQTP